MDNCIECANPVTERQESLQCDGCHKEQHYIQMLGEANDLLDKGWPFSSVTARNSSFCDIPDPGGGGGGALPMLGHMGAADGLKS